MAASRPFTLLSLTVLALGSICAQDASCPDPPAGGVPHGAAGDCTSHKNHTCTYTCNEGYQCSPECTKLPCAANCVRTCNNGTAFTAPMTCSEKPCTGVDPPDFGAHMQVGTCTDALLSGDHCTPTCDEGYVLTAHGGHSSGSHANFLCTRGTWNTLTCEPKGCTAAAVVAAASGARIWTPNAHGDPPFSCGALSDSQLCTPTQVGQHSVCMPGYTRSTNPPLQISCSTGTVTVLGSCDPSPCTCGDNYPHGNRGTCHPNGNHMESDTLCTPNCTDGYTLQDVKRCHRSACSGGTCIGKPCNATAIGVEHEVQPSKTFKQGARISEGSCTESLASGGTCQPECATGDGFVAHGVTTCSLGVITSISFCEAPKPTKALERMGFTQQTNTSGEKYWAAPDSAFRSGVVWLLYLCLVAIVMMGCCGTWKMASAKISKDEFESVTDWSRVE